MITKNRPVWISQFMVLGLCLMVPLLMATSAMGADLVKIETEQANLYEKVQIVDGKRSRVMDIRPTGVRAKSYSQARQACRDLKKILGTRSITWRLPSGPEQVRIAQMGIALNQIQYVYTYMGRLGGTYTVVKPHSSYLWANLNHAPDRAGGDYISRLFMGETQIEEDCNQGGGVCIHPDCKRCHGPIREWSRYSELALAVKREIESATGVKNRSSKVSESGYFQTKFDNLTFLARLLEDGLPVFCVSERSSLSLVDVDHDLDKRFSGLDLNQNSENSETYESGDDFFGADQVDLEASFGYVDLNYASLTDLDLIQFARSNRVSSAHHSLVNSLAGSTQTSERSTPQTTPGRSKPLQNQRATQTLLSVQCALEELKNAPKKANFVRALDFEEEALHIEDTSSVELSGGQTIGLYEWNAGPWRATQHESSEQLKQGIGNLSAQFLDVFYKQALEMPPLELPSSAWQY